MLEPGNRLIFLDSSIGLIPSQHFLQPGEITHRRLAAPRLTGGEQGLPRSGQPRSGLVHIDVYSAVTPLAHVNNIVLTQEQYDASFLISVSVIHPRAVFNRPFFSNCFSSLDTTSLAVPRCEAMS